MANKDQPFADLTADGSSSWVQVRSMMALDSAVLMLMFDGTWGGGTATIDFARNSDGDGAHDSGETGLTANGSFKLVVSPDLWIRATLTGATSPDLQGYGV